MVACLVKRQLSNEGIYPTGSKRGGLTSFISPELLQLLQLILPLLIGAWAYTIKRDSDARLKAVESDADARKATANQISQLLDMHNKQIMINQQSAAADLELKRSSEEGYRVIRGVQNDTNIQLTNLTNAIKELKLETIKAIGEQNKSVAEKVNELSKQMTTFMDTGMKEQLAFLGSEIGLSINRRVEAQDASTGLIKWPVEDDPGWKKVFLVPTKPDVILYRRPSYDDFNQVQKACARLKAAGQEAEIIANRLDGWLFVRKRNGEVCEGFLPEGYVKIGEAAPKPEMVH